MLSIVADDSASLEVKGVTQNSPRDHIMKVMREQGLYDKPGEEKAREAKQAIDNLALLPKRDYFGGKRTLRFLRGDSRARR